METLAPRTLYDKDELGITDRMPLVSGLVFGIGMGGFVFLEHLGASSSWRAAFGNAAAIGIPAGLLFGLLLPRLLGAMAARINDRLYAGDPTLVAPPDAERYQYRLPCGWMRSPAHAVGGVLYLGAGGLRFEPHLRNPARLRTPIAMEPVEQLSVALVEAPLPGWTRVWGRRSVPRIQVRLGQRSEQFSLPQAGEAVARLQERLSALQGGGPGRDHDRPT